MAKKTWTTPKGRAVFPRINGKPDTKFDKDGEWRIRVVLDNNEATQALMTALDEVHEESVAAAKKEDPKKKWKKGSAPYKILEGETEVEFSFVMKAQRTDKTSKEIVSMRPALFGADGKPLPTDAPIIGSDSIVRVGFNPAHTTFGSSAFVKLYLNAVQVIDLIPYQADGSKYGFGDESGEDESEFDTEENTDDNEETAAVEEEEETPAPKAVPTDRVAAKKADKAKAKAKAAADDF